MLGEHTSILLFCATLMHVVSIGIEQIGTLHVAGKGVGSCWGRRAWRWRSATTAAWPGMQSGARCAPRPSAVMSPACQGAAAVGNRWMHGRQCAFIRCTSSTSC